MECSGCHRLNPPETEMCLNCGDPLTALEGLFQRQLAIGTPLTQTRMQRQVAQLKEKESIASEKRMAEFQEIDRQREQDWAEAEALRRKSEHSTLRWVLGLTAVGVLLILLIILLLATSAS